MINIIDIPPCIRDKFLLYLNDYIKEDSRYLEVFKDRSPERIQLIQIPTKVVDVTTTHTLVTFTDGIELMVSDVFDEFHRDLKLTPNP